MTNSKTNLARSVTDRLKNISKKNKIPFETLQPYFLLERLAIRLTNNSDLGRRLVFKGGYVGIRVYNSPRTTVDLDALLTHGKLDAIQKTIIKVAEEDIGDAVWFRFSATQNLETLGEYGGLRILFRCGIGEDPSSTTRARLLNLDIGVGDPVTPVDVVTPALLGDGELSWQVYPIEVICAEKLQTLVARGSANSRSKDVYDLTLFLPRCDPKILKQALSKSFKYRGGEISVDLSAHVEKIDTRLLKIAWKSAVVGLDGVGNFDQAFKLLLNLISKFFPEKP